MALLSKLNNIIHKTKETPLISIIIPVYNAKKEDIEKAFTSIQNQTLPFTKIEVVFVNDKSTITEGIDLIKEYKKQYSNVKLYNTKTNSGAGLTRNLGIEKATGNYLMFLDHDDYYMPNACELLYTLIESEYVDIVSGNYIDGAQNNKTVNWAKQGITSYKTKVNTIEDNPNLLNLAPSSCIKIYRKSFLENEKLVYDDVRTGEDKIFNFKTLLKAKGIIFIDEPIITYEKRSSKDNTSKSIEYTFKNLEILMDVHNYCLEICKKELPTQTHIILNDTKYLIKSVLLNTTLDKDEFKLFVEKAHIFFKEYIENKNTKKEEKYLKISKYIANNDYTHAYYEYIDFRNKQTMYSQMSANITKPKKDSYNYNFDDISVSVIIPVYNNEAFLDSCLNSIHDQSLKNIEVICIDDNSTDNSLNILKQHTAIDNRFRVLHSKENKGVLTIRNSGIKQARGKYITFLDADDWLDLNALEKTVEIANKDNLDIYMFNHTKYTKKESKITDKNSDVIEYLKSYADKDLKNEEIDLSKLYSQYGNSYAKLYLKSFIQENNLKFNSKRMFCDNVFAIKSYLEAKNVKLTTDSFYNKRLHENTYTSSKDLIILDNIAMLNDVLKILLSNKALYESYKDKYYNYIFNMLREKFHKINPEYKIKYFQYIQKFIEKCVTTYKLDEDIQDNLTKTNLLFYYYILNSSKNLDTSITLDTPVSIVIYTRNILEKEINNIVNDFINQSMEFSMLELIFMDNNSAIKDTSNVIKNYENIFPNIKYVHLDKNYDQPQVFEIATGYATSPYIMYYNSNHRYVNTAIKNIFKAIRKDNMNVASGIIENKNDNGSNHLIWTKLFKTKFIKDNEITFYENEKHEILVADKIYDEKGIVNVGVPIIKS